MLRGFCLLVGLVAAGCGGAEGGSDPAPAKQQMMMPTPVTPVCEAGKTVECPCVNGGKGVQSCDNDGSKWGACDCADVKPPAPTETPAEACTRVDLPAEPAGCPAGFNGLYTDCPQAFLDSGVCVKANGFDCCPK